MFPAYYLARPLYLQEELPCHLLKSPRMQDSLPRHSYC
ncbi:hypothetical protein HMPREF9124_0707 [Oribacterium sp. oral taxon 108 str. F0425]|nr:hypothetical protein HMPREF9124_0707 [Oribacterium sp. oral taxon 108 str. F0425]